MTVKILKDVKLDNAEVMNIVFTSMEMHGYTIPALEIDNVGVLKPCGENGESVHKQAHYVMSVNEHIREFSIPQENGQLVTEGKEMVTSRYVWGNWTISEVVNHLVKTGQVSSALDEMVEYQPQKSQEFHEQVIVWAIFLAAKGWQAERELDVHSERYAKMWETHDLAGTDFKDTQENEDVNLKSYTFGRFKRQDEGYLESGQKLLFWAIIDGKMMVSPNARELRFTIKQKSGLPMREFGKYAIIFTDIQGL